MSEPQTPTKAAWDKACLEFAEYLSNEEKSDLTIKSYLGDLADFSAWYLQAFECSPPLLALSSIELREYKTHLRDTEHLAAATTNRRLSTLRSFLKWAQSEGLAQAIKMPKSVPLVRQPPRWLPRKDRLAFLRATERAEKRDRAIGLLYYHTGARLRELAEKARWRDVDVSARKGSIVLHGKGAKDRTVPLNAEARRALTDLGYPGRPDEPIFTGQRGPLGIQGVQGVIEQLAHEARLENCTCHVLRHTFCRSLAENGVRLEDIAALAGHSSLETTRGYVTPGKDELVAHVERLAGGEE